MINLSIEQLKLIFESGYHLGREECDLASKGWHYDSSSKDLELVYTLCDVLKMKQRRYSKNADLYSSTVKEEKEYLQKVSRITSRTS